MKTNKQHKQIRDIFRTQKFVDLQSVADEFGVTLPEFISHMCTEPELYRGGKMVDNMWTTKDDNKNWFLEIGRAFTGSDGIFRFKRGEFAEASDFAKVAKKIKGKDYHISVYWHDQHWLDGKNDTYIKPRYVYIELDRGTLQDAIVDAEKIVRSLSNKASYFEDGIYTWYSGNKSIHIGLDPRLFGSPETNARQTAGKGGVYYNIANMIAGWVRLGRFFDPWMVPVEKCIETYAVKYGKLPPNDPQLVRQAIESFDPNLYNLNSLIREPKCIHRKTQNPKTPVMLSGGVMLPTLMFIPNNLPPKLLHVYLENYNRDIGEIRRKKTKSGSSLNDSFVTQYFDQYIEGFDADRVNSAGWVYECYSPFYDDHRPSVSVCIAKGEGCGSFKDFGNMDDDCDFVDFVKRIERLPNRQQAEKFIRKNSK